MVYVVGVVAWGTLEPFQSSKIMVLGSRNPIFDIKKAHFESFLSKYSYLRPILVPILVAEHIYKPFTWVFMSWELLLWVHWRHFRALKIIVLGLEIQFLTSKKPILSHFSYKELFQAYFGPYFGCRTHLWTIFMVYVMGIVAQGTFEAFQGSENYSIGV